MSINNSKLEQFNNSKPGPIMESWKYIFALEKRLQSTCNKADEYRKRLTALDSKKKKLVLNEKRPQIRLSEQV